MAKILNMDRVVNPRPVSVIADVDLERGQLLAVKGMAKNNIWLSDMDDFEAYSVGLADANTKIGDLLVHTSVPNQYDERLLEQDFVLKAGEAGRGHYITVGDEYTFAKELFDNVVEGDKVALAEGGKFAKVVADEAIIGEVVKVYNWQGQDSIMIRFC